MNLFSRKLKAFSLAICSVIVATLFFPQGMSAATSTGKLSGIKEIVASSGFWGGSSFALGKDGTVWVWGSNVFGQFANGTAGPEGWTITPGRIPALDHTKQLVIGSRGYYLALKEEGTVTVWGDYPNHSSELTENGSLGRQRKVLLPQAISGMTDVVTITSGSHNTLALKKDGSVLQWVSPERAQSVPELPAATKVKGLSGVKWIGSGDYHAAIKDNGTLWLWAANQQSHPEGITVDPRPIKDLYHVKSVSMSGSSLAALTESGSVWTTISNENNNFITMKKMKGLSDIVSIQTKNGLNVAKNKKGEYWVWKADTLLKDLQKITAVNQISKLSLDLDGLVAVKKDGTVWTWQRNSSIENTLGFTQPKQIKGLRDPLSFAMGENSKYAVLKDGTAVAWGTNMFGQLGISALDSRPFTVSPVLKPVAVIVNGKKVDSIQPAIFLDGSVRVPLRDVAESLGYTLSWNGNLKLSKVGKDGSTKEIIYSEDKFINHDGSSIMLQPRAINVSYTLLVPAAALAKALGASAEWDSNLYQLTLRI